MFTYDVVSESVRNPHELAAELTRRSSEGWEVVQITFDGGSWFHAFIRHTGSVGVAPYPGMQESAVSPTASFVGGPLEGSAVSGAVAPPQASAGSAPDVPARWAKDPSSRFELRYWNGSAWTEHVSTGGVQSIDPPRA
jgi:hypothetical protein